MSHYSTVQSLIDVLEGDYNSLYDMLSPLDEDIDELVRAFVFVSVSLWGGTTLEFKKEFRENLTNKTVDEEIELIFWEEADD